jgi:hypothetical protein
MEYANGFSESECHKARIWDNLRYLYHSVGDTGMAREYLVKIQEELEM